MDWAELIEKSPFIAIILALGIVTVYLFKSRETLQKEVLSLIESSATKVEELHKKHTEDLVEATKALQELSSESLKQAFSDSASWQERVRELRETIRDYTREESDANKAILEKIETAKRETIDQITDRRR